MRLHRAFLVAGISLGVSMLGTAPSSAFSLKKLGRSLAKTVKVVERKAVNTAKDAKRIAGKDVKAVGKGIGGGAKAVANVGLKGADKVGNVARKGELAVTKFGYNHSGVAATAAMFGGPVGLVGKAAIVGVTGHITGAREKVLFKDNGQNRRVLPAKIK